jgi:glutathione S-transferase
MEKGYAALGVMERHLARQPFFVGGRFGLADIALYAYTHVAGEGGFNLDAFPHVNVWLSRVAAQPGHVTIDHRN